MRRASGSERRSRCRGGRHGLWRTPNDGACTTDSLDAAMTSCSVLASRSPQPDTSQCMRAPPMSSSVVFSPMTISAMRGDPRFYAGVAADHEDDIAETGMYAPPAADGPKSRQTCGIDPDSCNLVVEDLSGVATTRKHIDLVGDTGSGTVDEIDERNPSRPAVSLNADDLFHRARPTIRL